MSEKHLILHATAIRDHGGAEAIAELAGVDAARARGLLEELVVSGRAVKNQDSYLLAPAGRMILENQYSLYYAELPEDDGFMDAYERFERLNVELKQCITDWQTREVGGEQIPNDHTDRDYDEKILDRLDQVQEEIETILDEMAARLPRFAIYKDKLEAALVKAEGGEAAWVSDVKIDSYHTIWFALHEDLLRILGRTREE